MDVFEEVGGRGTSAKSAGSCRNLEDEASRNEMPSFPKKKKPPTKKINELVEISRGASGECPKRFRDRNYKGRRTDGRRSSQAPIEAEERVNK